MNERIFIPSNVISSKNSKSAYYNKAKGYSYVTSSKQSKNYVSDTKLDWVTNRNIFLELIADMEKPLKIEFQFIRKDRRKFDFVNMLQLPLDCMVKYEWIPDDDSLNVVPVINPEVLYSKDTPGVFIKPLNK